MTANAATALHRVNRPLYTFADTDRLAGATRGTSKRWLTGYWYLDTQGQAVIRPPVTPDSVEVERDAASFSDLVEVVAIDGLKRVGFSMKRIREIVLNCQEGLGVDRPLTKLKFKTDGREFYVDQGDFLLEVGKRKWNRAWNEVIGPFLESLDYADEVATRWWPLGKTTPVIIDPDYGYGFPVLADSGVRTEIIRERVLAGDLEDQIARDFNISSVEVQRAVQFELGRAA